jgi:hypothetical protein
MDAHLETITHAKLDDLANQFRWSRAAVFQQVMHWGLIHEPSGYVNRDNTRGPARHLYFVVEFELHQQVRQLAEAVEGDVALWWRHRLSEITPMDCPRQFACR